MAGKFSLEAIFTAKDGTRGVTAKIASRIDRMTRMASRGLGAMDRTMDSVHRGLGRFAIGIGAAGLAAGAGVAAIISPAMQLEDQLAKLQTVTTPTFGTMNEALAKSKKAALDWSKTHVATADQFIEAQYNMASAGLDNEQALAGTRAALTLATATMGDADTAGNLLATVFNNLGNKAAPVEKEMNRLADVLAKTQAIAQIKDLGQLNESLKMGAPAAIQFGVSVEQLSAALGFLNTAGLQGGMAGTAFAATMRQMGKASKALGFQIAKTKSGGVDFAGTIGNIEKKFGSFAKMSDKQKAAFQKAFGDEGIRSIALMLGKTEDFRKQLDAVTNSTGTAAAQEAVIEKSRAKQIQILKNRMEALAIKAGDALLPVLDQVAPEIEKIAKSASDWLEKNQGLISSTLVQFVKDVAANLPTIWKWMKRIAIGVAIFEGIRLAVKVAQTALAAYELTVAGVALAKRGLAAASALSAAGIRANAAAAVAAGAPMLALAAAATAAVAAIGLVMDQLGKLEKETEGLGLFDIFGEMVQQGTFDPFKAVDEHHNREARKRAAAEGRINTEAPDQGKAAALVADLLGQRQDPLAAFGRPGEGEIGMGRRHGEPQVITPADRTARTVKETITKSESEVTIRDESGKAEITRQPKTGAKLKLQQSGAF